MERLGSAQYRSEGFIGSANDIVIGLLCGQGAARGLSVEAEHPGTRIFCHETFTHDFSPYPACRPEFCDLFKEIDMRVKEEGEPRRKIIDIQTPLHRCLYIGNPIGQSESQF